MRRQLASGCLDHGKDAKTMELQKRCHEQAAEVSQLSSELDRLRAERKATAKKIPLREAADRDKVKLSYERKLFTDTVKLSGLRNRNAALRDAGHELQQQPERRPRHHPIAADHQRRHPRHRAT